MKNKKLVNFESLVQKAERDEKGQLVITGMASTNDVDRAGDVIEPGAWKGGLDNFMKNPIILFNHNYNKPIGKATGVEITNNGLQITAKISSAAKKVAKLIEDGVLSTFSVGFYIEDATYDEEKGGLRITKAQLVENSVVSVPCNPHAAFSVSKSFDSETDYNDFVSNFKDASSTGVNTAQEELASSAEESAKKEKTMSDKLKNENLVEDVATQVAAKMAMEQAKKDAAAKAAQEEAAKEAKIKELEMGKSGAEKVQEDLRAELAKKDADMAEVIAKFQKELEEKKEEMAEMAKSRRQHTFTDRDSEVDVKTWAKNNSDDLVGAHLLGVITGKGIEGTDFGKELFEKAGIQYTTNAPDLDQEIQDRILKEVNVFTRVKDLFREVTVNGASTVMPFQTDTNRASWAADAAPDGNLENRTQVAANEFHASQVILNAYRLVSASFVANDTDEQVLVNLMPMMVEGVGRAHARATEFQLLMGNANPFSGLDTFAFASTAATAVSAAAPGSLTALDLLKMRGEMGKFGLNPEDLAFIVNQTEYYSLLEDGAFANLNEVGAMATKIKGIVGAVYNTPVIVSDEFPSVAQNAPAAFAVNTRNYLVPRLRGVTVEQDYEVMNQRRVIVASQALGFTEIQAGNGSTFEPVVKLDYAA